MSPSPPLASDDADDEKTSAPEANESISIANREESILGSCKNHVCEINLGDRAGNPTLRISSRSSENASTMVAIQNLRKRSLSCSSSLLSFSGSSLEARNDGMGTGFGGGEGGRWTFGCFVFS